MDDDVVGHISVVRPHDISVFRPVGGEPGSDIGDRAAGRHCFRLCIIRVFSEHAEPDQINERTAAPCHGHSALDIRGGMGAAEAGDIVPDRPGNGVILHVGHVGLFRRSILFDGLRLLSSLFDGLRLLSSSSGSASSANTGVSSVTVKDRTSSRIRYLRYVVFTSFFKCKP